MATTAQDSVQDSALGQFRDYLRLDTTQEAIVDAGVYTLALGALYVSYHYLVGVAMANKFSTHPAHIVAGLADLAVLVFARKADLAARQGRRAPVLRLVVVLMGCATVLLNVRDSWPHLLPSVLHLLPPVVWIIAQEAMLHGKRLTYHARRRAEQVAKGLRPAEVAHLSWHQVLLSPRRNLQRLRVMWLTGTRADQAAAYLVERWEADPGKSTKPTPLAWTALATAEEADPLPLAAPRPAPVLQAASAPQPLAIPVQPSPVTALHTPGPAGKQLTKFDTAVQAQLLDAVDPFQDGNPIHEAAAAVDRVEQVCRTHNIKMTGVLLAELLNCSPAYISKVNSHRQRLATPGAWAAPANP